MGDHKIPESRGKAFKCVKAHSVWIYTMKGGTLVVSTLEALLYWELWLIHNICTLLLYDNRFLWSQLNTHSTQFPKSGPLQVIILSSMLLQIQ